LLHSSERLGFSRRYMRTAAKKSAFRFPSTQVCSARRALLGDSDHRGRLQSIDVARCIHSQLIVTKGFELGAGEEPWADGDLSAPCGTCALLCCARLLELLEVQSRLRRFVQSSEE
jgi:hypothetical protein